jgi:hypothetical protein
MNTPDSRLDEPSDEQREQSRSVILVRDDGTHQLIGEVIAGPGSTWTAFGVASDRRKSKLGSFPTLAAAKGEVFAAKPLPKDMERRNRIRGLRKQAITKFREEQQKALQWIHLHKVADHCSKTADPTLPPDKKDGLYVNALISLLESALNGEFETIDGKSRLLRAHHDYRIRRSWLSDPNSAPPEAFVSKEDLQNMVALSDAIPPGVPERHRNRFTSKGKVACSIIANCWVPRELGVWWLESRRPPITAPVAWLQNATPPSAKLNRTNSNRRRPAQERIKLELEEKAPQYLDGPGDKNSYTIAALLVKTKGSQRGLEIDKTRKALEGYYANRRKHPPSQG